MKKEREKKNQPFFRIPSLVRLAFVNVHAVSTRRKKSIAPFSLAAFLNTGVLVAAATIQEKMDTA